MSQILTGAVRSNFKLSETKILVDETPNNVPDAANGETTP